MPQLQTGRYRVRIATDACDLRAARQLRFRCFRAPALVSAWAGAEAEAGEDADPLDAHCRHMLVEHRESGRLAACFRWLPLGSGAEIGRSYSAQHYELSRLRDFPEPMIEVGRFCVDPAHSHPEILRLAWAALARQVDETGAGLLFGCSSFAGLDASGHARAFALLRDRHRAPPRWRPGIKAPEVCRFAALPAAADPASARAGLPPLLRSYLAMGGWVSDHAVLDRELRTMHVFTGVEVRLIPPARVRALRRLAG
ncbi:MAG TPA: GNAT family N-acetyltransferase [Paracoccus solventivorans]|uniref:L-ornithine N(alpha)-acyltransferase n=1 Tax=Paracoccus solventivorans TaxID=53463 RepID=A0A832QVC2_9RHOB|nr:GNAT family N-acetyltransferase [Paracoccus solventivorans]HHW33077.1 GNAT family N-acetyltransferase [Paracoccus solventivorans]